MKKRTSILLLLLAASIGYACSGDFNGFYRQTADSMYKPCAIKNKETIENIKAQCQKDGQKNCHKKAVTWVCENKWRNY